MPVNVLIHLSGHVLILKCMDDENFDALVTLHFYLRIIKVMVSAGIVNHFFLVVVQSNMSPAFNHKMSLSTICTNTLAL